LPKANRHTSQRRYACLLEGYDVAEGK
jgi:hypothetical protein